MPISALGVALSICLFSSPVALSATTKIDPVLSLMLQRGPSRLSKGHGILKSAPGAREPFVKTIIRFEGSLSGVESLGGKIGSIIGDISTADIPVSGVDPISKLPNIVYIEAAKRHKRAQSRFLDGDPLGDRHQKWEICLKWKIPFSLDWFGQTRCPWNSPL